MPCQNKTMLLYSGFTLQDLKSLFMTKLLKRSFNTECLTIKRKDLPVVVADHDDDFIARLMKRSEDDYMARIIKKDGEEREKEKRRFEKRPVCPGTVSYDTRERDQDSYLFTLSW